MSLPTRDAGSARPHVEVVVPCHNYGRYLEQCVASVLGQPGVRTTVTIVDDASTDDSARVARRLADQHPEVRLLRNETNLGAVRTFNRGLEDADSDYVSLLSADDLLAPGALARATALMEAHPHVGLVYGHARKFADEPPRAANGRCVTWTTWDGDDWIALQLRRAWNNISSPEAVVRTSVQHAAGYYDPGLPHTHDVEMWLRIAALSGVGHVNGPDQAFYRRHVSSLSSQVGSYGEIWERWRAYDQFLAAWPDRERAGAARPHVRRRLAQETLDDLLADLEGPGEVCDEVVQEALALAARLDPGASRSARWIDARARLEGRRPGTAGERARALTRATARRVHWRRYRRFRYLG